MKTSRYICSNVIRHGTIRARNCTNPARWQFWEPSMSTIEDHPYYSCTRCLSAQMSYGGSVGKFVVQRIEY